MLVCESATQRVRCLLTPCGFHRRATALCLFWRTCGAASVDPSCPQSSVPTAKDIVEQSREPHCRLERSEFVFAVLRPSMLRQRALGLLKSDGREVVHVLARLVKPVRTSATRQRHMVSSGCLLGRMSRLAFLDVPACQLLCFSAQI